MFIGGLIYRLNCIFHPGNKLQMSKLRLGASLITILLWITWTAVSSQSGLTAGDENASACVNSSYQCGMELRLIVKPLEVDGYQNCVERGVQVICSGYCPSQSEPVGGGMHMIFTECMLCQGKIRKELLLLVPHRILCDNKLIKIRTRPLFIPNCKCEQCPGSVI